MTRPGGNGPDARPPDAYATPDDLVSLLEPLRRVAGGAGALIAVSGGSDSMALLVLVARYLKACPSALGPVVVVTVDHGLRAESGQEAAGVAQSAARLGFEHVTLRWEGKKPATGLAEAARDARYALIAGLMRSRGMQAVATGHTRDDQAETLLMRLARGSGVDGLAAMTTVAPLPSDPELSIVRPLLGLSRAQLRGVLARESLTWVEDPSNADDRQERPRLRAARAVLDSLGLTPDSLALSATRLQRARQALSAIAAAFLTSPAVHVDPLGFIRIGRAAYAGLEPEISLRVLQASVAAVGGAGESVSLSALEALHGRLGTSGQGGWTLGRAALAIDGEDLLIEREPGRTPPPTLPLLPGCDVTWDGRFRVRTGEAMPAGHSLAPLLAEGLAALLSDGGQRPARVSSRCLHALPAIWREGKLIAVPGLNFAAKPLQLPLSVVFKGLSRPG